jgi:MSHA biogenesis protein MshP
MTSMANRSRRRQRGSALLIALFVMVLAAGIAASLARTATGAAQAGSLSHGSAQVRFAAQAGVQWARHRIQRDGGCVTGELTLRDAALRGYTVSVDCRESAHDDAGTATRLFVIDARARFAAFGSPDYVSAVASEQLALR